MTVTLNGWLGDLANPEPVLAVMREIRDTADRFAKESRDLSPSHGQIAVGGEHFDRFCKGDSLANFLSGLGKGLDPESAKDFAITESKVAVKKWNDSRKNEYQVHRWDGMAISTVEAAWRKVLRAAGV